MWRCRWGVGDLFLGIFDGDGLAANGQAGVLLCQGGFGLGGGGKFENGKATDATEVGTLAILVNRDGDALDGAIDAKCGAELLF